MDNRHGQRGVGLIGIFIFIMLLGFGALFGWKVSTPYFNKKLIDEKVAVVLSEAKNDPLLQEPQIKERIIRKLSVDNLSIGGDNIEVQPAATPGEWKVRIPIVSRTKLWEGAFLVIELEVEQQSK